MSWKTILSFSLIISIYGSICFYIGINGWAWLKSFRTPQTHKLYWVLLIVLSLSIFIGHIFPYTPIKWLSGYWMAIVGYSLLLLPIANFIYFLLKRNGGFWIGLAVIAVYLLIFIFGSFQAFSPVVRSYDVEVPKKSSLPQVKIVMASDLHLGNIVGKRHLHRLIKITEKEQPDIILLPGDIIDDHIEPYRKLNMQEEMGKLSAPLGVYAVVGNHEYYGKDFNEIVKEMEKAGIYCLLDETISIDDQFYLVGRKDRTDHERKSVEELVQNLDFSKPIIMMDHQPSELEIAEKSGVDIVLSGHTHRGQLAPAHLITKRLFENDWGYLKKGNLHSIVSSGFGTWGPPLRIGSRSEVLIINVHFSK